MGNEDRFFYLDESPYYTSKYVIRMNHSKFPFPHGADGSYNLIAARLLGLSYASYLRFARDVLGAEIVGKRHRFPVAYFEQSDAVYQLVKLLNQRMKYLMIGREK